MRKGFTLVELLAVIAILSIVLLIAIPVVTKLTKDAGKSADLSSGKLYVKSVNNSILDSRLNGNYKIGNGTYTIDSSGNVCLDTNCTQTLTVQAKGKKPTGGTLRIEKEEVVCTGTELVFPDYTVTCNSNKEYVIVGSDGGGSGSSNTNQRHFDTCTYTDDDSSSGISIGDKVTCGTEGFYVIKTPSNGVVTMISEWNLNVIDEGSNARLCSNDDVGYQATCATGIYANGGNVPIPGVIAAPPRSRAQFADSDYWTIDGDLDTSSYDACSGDSYCEDGYPVYVYGNNTTIKTFITSYVNLLNSAVSGANAQGRLISYEELIGLGCDSDTKTCSDEELEVPVWLYQTSYWTGSASDEESIFVMDSHIAGEIGTSSCSAVYGVRPVIEISSSVINLAS